METEKNWKTETEKISTIWITLLQEHVYMDVGCELMHCVLQCLCGIAVVISIEVYRVAVRTALYWHDHPLIYKHAEIFVSGTASVINLAAIIILELVSSILQCLHVIWISCGFIVVFYYPFDIWQCRRRHYVFWLSVRRIRSFVRPNSYHYHDRYLKRPSKQSRRNLQGLTTNPYWWTD